MRQIWIGVLLAAAIGLTGCGGGGGNGGGGSTGTTGSVSGCIKNQAGTPLAKISIKVGSQEALTDSQGNFTLNSVPAGNCQLTGAGGEAKHYIVEPANLTVVAGSKATVDLTAYQIYGCGVVYNTGNLTENQLALKKMSQLLLSQNLNLNRSQNQIPRRNAINKSISGNLLNYWSYIFVEWEQVKGISDYVVRYQGQEVWNSKRQDGTDPPYNTGTTLQAYLDLGAELAGKIERAGVYEFQIVGIGSDGQEKALPKVSVSLGNALDGIPTGIAVADRKVTWNAVTGAEGYQVKIFADMPALDTSPVHTSDLITTSSLDLNGIRELETLSYGVIWVEACTFDALGWPAEISRSVGASTF